MPADPVVQRDKIDALDKAYRSLKANGGAYRIAWQQARTKIMQTGTWEDLGGTPAMDELLAAAEGFRE